jgi:hypothetical protein
MTEIPTGPIPGENYTSDQRNYPWHRPPEFTDLDDCLEIAAKKILNQESSRSLVTMMEMGVPITALTSAFVLSGVGSGKWTPDYAMLLAGPVSHMMVLLAKGNKIDYKLGTEERVAPPTSVHFKSLQKDNAKIRTIESILPDVEKRMEEVKESRNFMDMARQMSSQVNTEEIPTQTEGEI